MSQLIDRRENASKKSTVNRTRFLRRYKNQIKQAVSDAIGKRSIREIDKGEKISIPAKDISEPHFYSGQGGRVGRVFPGNEEFLRGDRIARPENAGGQGGQSTASQDGESEDDFVFQLTREEFLDLYFDDLELPDLVRKELSRITNFQTHRAGFTTAGTPTNINVLRSMKQATSRRKALSAPYRRRLEEAEMALKALSDDAGNNDDKNNDGKKRQALEETIAFLNKKLAAIPFIDTFDLRYHRRVRVPTPSIMAVMFCVMDVSGSMDEAKKEIAKRFFILLYLFLSKNYEKIDIVFIRHHTSAKEVNEEEFFYSRETGGTVVSSALELLHEIISNRYPPSAWNVYVAQASDGDNWNADSPYCQELLNDKIMPMLQYYAYIEIMPRHHQSLWEVYQEVHRHYPNFAMENIDTNADIYPVFRELFKRKTKS
jgi:uncharacterized sporulation protein YeaH/YhbH (DUF444 family)